MVTNLEGIIQSRGYDVKTRVDPAILSQYTGVIEHHGLYRVFGRVRFGPQEAPLGYVVVVQALSGNRTFFDKLKAVVGKDALLWLGEREVGSTFDQPFDDELLLSDESLEPFQPTPVAPGLFTAYDQRYIGAEQLLEPAFGRADWRAVPLQSAAPPLIQAIYRVQAGTVIFTLAFIGLMALVVGLFFAAHIRRPMIRIGQGIAAITQGHLETRLHLGRRDEWRMVEEALNSMAMSLAEHEVALQRHTAELEARVQERTAELAQANTEINALNLQLQAENLRLGAELEITRQIQQMLLPTEAELRAIDGLDIACYMEPAEEVGGDYYDVLQHQGRIKIGIGDVTGHGLESGVVMVMTQAVVRALLTNGETDPVRFLDTLNRALYGNVQRMGTDKNLTLALLDYANGEVKLSGQHEEMIVVRHSGILELIDTIDLGFPIALDDEIADFIDHTSVTLEPGDGVVLYTDGITEAANTDGNQYGLDRLCEVVCKHWAQSSEAIKDAVVHDVWHHIGQQEVYDDITLVVVKQR